MSEPTATGPDAELVADYEALRRTLGAHRVERDFLSVHGPEAFDYLQGQLSQDLATLAVGDGAEALLLAPDGKLVALLGVTRRAEDDFVLDVDRGFAAVVLERLGRFKLRAKVTFEPLEWSLVALRGPAVPAVVEPSAPSTEAPCFTRPVTLGGTSGLDLLGPVPELVVPSGARWCGNGAWEALRIEAGLPKMGAELDERTIPAEAQLLDRSVSFTKGCYTGQELVARMEARGNKVARRLCGLVLEHPPPRPERWVGATLRLNDHDKELGRLTSIAWCPGLGAVGALGFLHRSVELPARLELHGPDGATESAQSRSLPMV